ncbi:crossover junction endodeoxyribonuclease RuvC [Helicobacter sp. MIT 99-5507]|uniref:crossover junction endodeoxyribonuclease RuvC n=1 Tax=Helicobacter sp. MIT 99-5507 TaxID=152489 RepID=UPI000E1E7F68|nr:crossover junction endodeoxyribonuclease RuvC [Helicobacter sp. MIT 99-5507]RDU58053.1 crossover junction endodeoxyribonuclease RuvC [Helicobacter sp. MIT 99-5507]
MNILGIDPGSRNCGYAIINSQKNKINLIEAGLIKIKTTDFKEQILELISGLDLIFKSKKIDIVVIENVFYAYNPKSVLKLAQFRGAIVCKVMQEFGNFYEYTPLQIKKSITGNGKADKIQVSFMVRRILGIKNEIKPLDVTDAIAIAITHHNCNK